MNVILSGPGRSGTTLFNQLFSYHKDFAWVSGWVNKYPYLPLLSLFNYIYQNQLLGINWAEVKFSPKPAEAYTYWNYYLEPFTSKNYNYNQNEIKKVRLSIEKIKKITNKKHFVTKITGDTRYHMLNEIFENDLIYLWIERDPRVVVSSYIKQKWGFKDKPDVFSRMSTEEKIKINAERYLDYFYQAKQINKKLFFYEDMCENPTVFFENLFNAIGLNLDSRQKKIINSREIKPINWKNHYLNKYTEREIGLLNDLLREPLMLYKYI
ncbi:MAG: sulfotransferase domain-containing protein [Psychroflexus halocasei]